MAAGPALSPTAEWSDNCQGPHTAHLGVEASAEETSDMLPIPHREAQQHGPAPAGPSASHGNYGSWSTPPDQTALPPPVSADETRLFRARVQKAEAARRNLSGIW